MQFMNSNLEKLVKNLSDDHFKYLIKEFGSKNLELLKQKDTYPLITWAVLQYFVKQNCLIKNVFTALPKTEELVIMVKN